MEQKTTVSAPDGKQEIIIRREFDLPVEALFSAYTEPEFLEQWMGTKVLKAENRINGTYQFQTTDGGGKVVFGASGVYAEFEPNRKITRTFKMDNTPLDVQLEYLDFEELTPSTSRLSIHMVFRSVAFRDQMVQFGLAKGISMAHNALQQTMEKALAKG